MQLSVLATHEVPEYNKLGQYTTVVYIHYRRVSVVRYSVLHRLESGDEEEVGRVIDVDRYLRVARRWFYTSTVYIQGTYLG